MNQITTEKAIKTLLKSPIDALPIELSDVEKIIEDRGYHIIPYNVNDPKDVEKLEEIDAYSIAKSNKWFTCCSKYLKAVFYRRTLDSQERLNVFTHELGHIVLEHFSKSGILGYEDILISNISQEKEAENFRKSLLAPICILKKARIRKTDDIIRNTLLNSVDANEIAAEFSIVHTYTPNEQKLQIKFQKYIRSCTSKRRKKRSFITSTAIIIFIMISIATAVSVKHSEWRNTTSYTPTETTHMSVSYSDAILNRQVVITRTGCKFHRPDCRYVKSKSDLATMTIQEALGQGLEPCTICEPTE